MHSEKDKGIQGCMFTEYTQEIEEVAEADSRWEQYAGSGRAVQGDCRLHCVPENASVFAAGNV